MGDNIVNVQQEEEEEVSFVDRYTQLVKDYEELLDLYRDQLNGRSAIFDTHKGLRDTLFFIARIFFGFYFLVFQIWFCVYFSQK